MPSFFSPLTSPSASAIALASLAAHHLLILLRFSLFGSFACCAVLPAYITLPLVRVRPVHLGISSPRRPRRRLSLFALLLLPPAPCTAMQPTGSLRVKLSAAACTTFTAAAAAATALSARRRSSAEAL